MALALASILPITDAADAQAFMAWGAGFWASGIVIYGLVMWRVGEWWCDRAETFRELEDLLGTVRRAKAQIALEERP